MYIIHSCEYLFTLANIIHSCECYSLLWILSTLVDIIHSCEYFSLLQVSMKETLEASFVLLQGHFPCSALRTTWISFDSSKIRIIIITIIFHNHNQQSEDFYFHFSQDLKHSCCSWYFSVAITSKMIKTRMIAMGMICCFENQMLFTIEFILGLLVRLENWC